MGSNHDDNQDPIAYIGMRERWGTREAFGLSTQDRRQHLYCVGKTGTGKSTLLRNLILQDIYAGRGVGLIDPHGDLALSVIDCIPSERTDDVVYFNPSDLAYPIGFNLLHNVNSSHCHRVASGLVGAMKSIWKDSWGPRMEYILYAAIAALLECENTSILGLQRMLTDTRYRRWAVRQVTDPIVRSFWMEEFEAYEERFRREAVAPILNKVGQLVMAPPLRHILGQVKRKIDPRFMMDDRRIFIANLSKGLLGADKANLLGSMLLTSFELAAMSRADVPEYRREDFFLYVDEFHNFTTDAFQSMLAEARKYRLCLTLSHQYLDQVDESIRHAVFGNAGSAISFRVGERDAAVLAQEFGEDFAANRFSALGNYEIMAKILAHGQHQVPFSGRTLGPLDVPRDRRKYIVARSRQKYASRRSVVEKKIQRWMGG